MSSVHFDLCATQPIFIWFRMLTFCCSHTRARLCMRGAMSTCALHTSWPIAIPHFVRNPTVVCCVHLYFPHTRCWYFYEPHNISHPYQFWSISASTRLPRNQFIYLADCIRQILRSLSPAILPYFVELWPLLTSVVGNCLSEERRVVRFFPIVIIRLSRIKCRNW